MLEREKGGIFEHMNHHKAFEQNLTYNHAALTTERAILTGVCLKYTGRKPARLQNLLYSVYM